MLTPPHDSRFPVPENLFSVFETYEKYLVVAKKSSKIKLRGWMRGGWILETGYLKLET